jgi:hypothetical protein
VVANLSRRAASGERATARRSTPQLPVLRSLLVRHSGTRSERNGTEPLRSPTKAAWRAAHCGRMAPLICAASGDGKGTRQFRRRPWPAESASEMAGSGGNSRGFGQAAGARARFMREARGRRRERHRDVRKTSGTSPWREGDVEVGKSPLAPVVACSPMRYKRQPERRAGAYLPKKACLSGAFWAHPWRLPGTCRPCAGSPTRPRVPGVSEAATACPGRLRNARDAGPPPLRPAGVASLV